MNNVLIDLQSTDTAADQLTHRRTQLPELTTANEARALVTAWERDRNTNLDRLGELDILIRKAEANSADIDAHRSRLQQQMKTVIALREAEALQHEISTLNEQRSANDDVELAALEEQAAIDDEMRSRTADEPALRAAQELAEAALAAALVEIDRELSDLSDRRTELRAQVAEPLLERYDRLRSQLGVAVAVLKGHRCEGCHLDLSAAEVDTVKEVGPGELAECPQCGRLLAI